VAGRGVGAVGVLGGRGVEGVNRADVAEQVGEVKAVGVVAHRFGHDRDAGHIGQVYIHTEHGGVGHAALDGDGGEPALEVADEVELKLVVDGDAGQVGKLGANGSGRFG